MTDEERRYIISEHRRGRTYRAIAPDLGITAAAISLDRRRHRDIWEYNETLLEQSLKWGRDRILTDLIKQCREQLMKLQSLREECEAKQKAILAANPNPHPEVLKKIVEKGVEMEVELAKDELKLYMLLSNILPVRYDLS